MGISRKEFGRMPDGEMVFLYTLKNDNGISAVFTDLGGIWVSMMVPDKDGKMDDVVLGYDSVAAYMQNPPHFGAPIGRNANRIGGAKFTLLGRHYTLESNDGDNNLHSGLDFYRTRAWDTETEESDMGPSIRFSLFSPDGDQGYPGNAQLHVTYTLLQDDSVMIHYEAFADTDTVMNMTNHSYFNLAGHSRGMILEQQVWIDADSFTPTDAASIPLGNILPVEGTPMDFRTLKPIGRDIEADYDQVVMGRGFDHNWVLNHEAGEAALCAKAYDQASGRVMEVYTDLPGIQFYTGNFLDHELPGKGKADYGFRAGYCFETQYYPDAVNQPQFPSPILKAGEVYDTTTVYKFSVDK